MAGNLATVTGFSAAGGTTLARSPDKRGWAERTWGGQDGGSGSGCCSAYVAKPAWQRDPQCGMRTVADVSAVASNVAVYDKARGGWLLVDGTSAAAPLIAGVYGLAGNASTIAPGYEYGHAASLFDITAGKQRCAQRNRRRDLRLRLPVRGQQWLRRTHRPRHLRWHRRLLT